MTRRYEKRKKDDIVRHCKHCGITNNDIPFLVQKDTKTGRFYKHCVCKACNTDLMSARRISYYIKNRVKQIADARRWNVENSDRYNKRRRKSFIEKWCKV